MDKKSKAIIGIGALAAAYFMLGGTKSEDVGSSGNFGGLGSGGIEELSGETDSGIPYNISFPSIDPSPIFSIMNEPPGGNTVVTPDGETPVKPKKENVIFSNIQEQDGSLGRSLGQVFGTESQKTNERGDYYTTSAGGGAGAVKGKSLGEMFIDTVKNITTSKGVDTKIYTGASTASQKTIGDISDIDFKSLVPVNNDMGASTLGKNPDGSSLFSSPFALPSSSGESKSLTTTKKTSGIKKQGGSGTGESKVKIVKKK